MEFQCEAVHFGSGIQQAQHPAPLRQGAAAHYSAHPRLPFSIAPEATGPPRLSMADAAEAASRRSRKASNAANAARFILLEPHPGLIAEPFVIGGIELSDFSLATRAGIDRHGIRASHMRHRARGRQPCSLADGAQNFINAALEP